MDELMKLKYRHVVKDIGYFYNFLDKWNAFIFQNPTATKEEKLQIANILKVKEPEFYILLTEDIFHGRI